MKDQSPAVWKRLRRGEEHDYKILKVREDTYEDPRNHSEHPRFRIDSPDWINVIPVTRDGKVICIRQFRAGVEGITLEIPGGMVDAGEDPLEAAGRELEEETGYRAGRIEKLGWVHPNPAFQSNRCHSFLALDCEKVHEGQQDVGEDISVELVDRGEIPQRILRGEISHSLVVVAFYLEGLRRTEGSR